MLIGSFFSWWYGAGWKEVIKSFGPRLRKVADSFSVDQLLRTLFEPWKRIISYPGASLEDKMRAWGDNIFSRCIGFVVRSMVLFAALLSSIAIGLLTTLEIVLWPLAPLLVPVLIFLGLTA